MEHERDSLGPRVCIGIFSSPRGADRAVELLHTAGFTHEEVSVVCAEALRDHFENARVQVIEPAGSHTATAATVGAGTLGLLGGLAAAGLTAGAAIPVVAAGALLGGLSAGAVGGFLGAMSTRSLEPEIADYYDQALERDKILVSVDHSDPARLAEAERVLDMAGAEPHELPRG